MKFLSQINVNTEYTLPIVDGVNGQVLATDGNGTAYWGSISAGATNLNALTDVVISSPSSGQLLRYGIPVGSEDPNPVWYNWSPNYLTPSSSIDNLGDVTITSVTAGQLLQWNGSAWVNATLSTVEYVSKVQHLVKAGVAITKGQAVYVTGSDGTNMVVGLASNTSEGTSSKVIGLAASNAATNDQIFVVTEGLLAGLNTSTATAGDPVWLGTNGNLIFGLLNKPVAPAHLVYIGVVTRAQQNNGEIFVNVQNGFELNEIHDALITSPTAGQLLRRDSDNLWKNWTPNYLTAEADTLATVTARGATTTGNITVNGAAFATSFSATGLLITNADTSGSLQPDQGSPANKIYSFRWQGLEQGYIDTDAKITFAGFKTPTGTASQFLKANGTVDSNVYITSAALSGYATQAWVNSNFYTQGQIDDFFGGAEPISGYNKSNWDTAYGWGNHASAGYATTSYVNTAIANLVDTAPDALNTLNELAAALGDDPNFATTVTNNIATKVSKSGDTMTGNLSFGSSTRQMINLWSTGYGIGVQSSTTYFRSDSRFSWHRGGSHNDGENNPGGGTVAMTLDSSSNLIVTGTISASGYNKTNWDTAFSWGNHAGLYLGINSKAADSEAVDGIDSSRIVYGDGPRASTSSASINDPNQKSGFYFQYEPVGAPFAGEWFNWMTVAGNSWQSSNNYSFQLAHQFHGEGFYVRRMTNGEAYSWRQIWDSGNLTNLNQLTNGPGYITGYTETDTLATVTARGGSTGSLVVLYGKVSLGNNTSGTYNGNVAGLTLNSTAEIRSTSAQNPPALTWHYEGLATRHLLMTSGGALNFVSPSNEASGVAVVQVNGNNIWHAGNDGSGSGLDADLLDGYHETSFVRLAANSSSPTNGTFAIGSASGRNFIQSHSGQPLDINPLGNGVNVGSTLTVSGAVYATATIVTASEGREVQTYMPSSYTTDDLVSGHEYGWYSDHWRLGMTRSGGAGGADFVIQWNGARRLSLTNGGGLTVTGVVSASGGNSGQWNTAYGWGNHADAPYWNVSEPTPQQVEAQQVTFAGDVIIQGTLTESSSIRFKENITPLDPALDKVNQLGAVSYNKIGVDDREIGLIAEEVAELFPEVVTYNDEGAPTGVQYQRLSVILLKAVQELTERVNKLENK